VLGGADVWGSSSSSSSGSGRSVCTLVSAAGAVAAARALCASCAACARAVSAAACCETARIHVLPPACARGMSNRLQTRAYNHAFATHTADCLNAHSRHTATWGLSSARLVKHTAPTYRRLVSRRPIVSSNSTRAHELLCGLAARALCTGCSGCTAPDRARVAPQNIDAPHGIHHVSESRGHTWSHAAAARC
jgi:hypothetical protein